MPATRALMLLVACGLAAAVSACGRRGALEPPGGRAAVTREAAPVPASARAVPQSLGLGGGSREPDPAAVQDGEELSAAAVPPSGTEAPVRTARGAKRGYTVPKEPFILDPLL